MCHVLSVRIDSSFELFDIPLVWSCINITLATRIEKTLILYLMAAKLDLAPLPPFDPLSEPSSLGQRWKNWTKRFQTYIVAMNITDDKQKRALLLYQAGPATQEIFETLSDTGDDYKTAQEKLDAYFLPKKNVDYEIFQFRQAMQQPSETIDQYVTRLRKLAAHCEFQDLEKELKSTIIQHCQSKTTSKVCIKRGP